MKYQTLRQRNFMNNNSNLFHKINYKMILKILYKIEKMKMKTQMYQLIYFQIPKMKITPKKIM